MILSVVQGAAAKPAEVIDYMRLPPPIKYEELQRESMSASLSQHTPYNCTCLAVSSSCSSIEHLVWDFCIYLFENVIDPGVGAVTLKPELFEGLRFDFTKPLNQNFALCHR